MKLEIINPNIALNKAYVKHSLNRDDIELFKKNLIHLFERINESESEEHNKNIVSDFLKDTYYKTNYEINTAGRKDLVIHLGKTSSEPVAVIIEAKRPDDKAGMINNQKANTKSVHELIHYYLHERFIKNNKEIRNLIITDIYQWYIFDATEFEKLFFNNKQFVKTYNDWHVGVLPSKNTDWFYQEIAKPFIEKEIQQIKCTYFNLREYESIIKNEDKTDDTKLIQLYKLLSPQHLLKLPFANDSNVLNKDFYNELLHIIGLEESKVSTKKVIERKVKNRNAGSLLENTINIVSIRNKTTNLERPDLFGETEDEQVFSIALELSITWLNRILFLKLLEGQLIKYHKGNRDFAFLNSNKIKDFDELDELFFEVLAVKPEYRSKSVNQIFGDLPYLNSSLFERTELENKTIQISELKDRLDLPVFNLTVLKDTTGKRISGNKNTIEYLFEFLNAYNFSSDTTAEILEENKTIINAAVLGLIFEKINGYKDGSFYRPGFITTYICRETLRKSVIQKFSEFYKRQISDFEHLKEFIDPTDKEQRQKANEIINSIKICDPAVGSGHFLVSILNEMIAIKSELQILSYSTGQRIKEYKILNESDELIITDKETEESFTYILNEKHRPIEELQLLQESLFNEKRNLIEKCLFGVDINPKSVSICRLRLWIELLKNSYYTKESDFKYLETLPNIDINIKSGNSLVNRYSLDADIRKALKQSKWNIESYKFAVKTYQNAPNKNVKLEMERLILKIKQDYSSEIRHNDPLKNRIDKLANEIYNRFTGNFLFEPQAPYGKKEKELEKQKEKERKKLETEIEELTTKMEDFRTGKAYEKSFEWRFEFPEVLNNEGDFVGFDVVIGNPPYFSVGQDVNLLEVSQNYETYQQTGDIYMLFMERGLKILAPQGFLCMITSNKWLRSAYGQVLRRFLLQNSNIELLVDFGGVKIFEEATVDTNIILISKSKSLNNNCKAVYFEKSFKVADDIETYINKNITYVSGLTSDSWNIANDEVNTIKQKMNEKGKILEFWDIEINRGILTGYNEAFFIDSKTRNELIDKDPNSAEIIKPLLRGRDVHHYYIDNKDQYLINTYNGKLIDEIDQVTGKKQRIRVNRIEVSSSYPAVYEYLKQFETKLKEREDQGEHWTNHRNCAYQHLFHQPKLIYPETTVRRSEFYYDTKGYLTDKTCFILTGENLKYLNGVLCSKLIEYYLETELRTLGKTSIQYSKQYMEKLPIPEITGHNKEIAVQIEKLVDSIILEKDLDIKSDTKDIEKQINKLVYKLYDLSKEEIELIEK